MDDNNAGYLSVAETARRLNRSIEQVRRYLREGQLAGRRIGQQWFIDEAAIEAFGARRPVARGLAPAPAETAEVAPVSVAEPAPAAPAPADPNKPLISDEAWAQLDALREEVRKQGGELDIVALLRQEREERQA